MLWQILYIHGMFPYVVVGSFVLHADEIMRSSIFVGTWELFPLAKWLDLVLSFLNHAFQLGLSISFKKLGYC